MQSPLTIGLGVSQGIDDHFHSNREPRRAPASAGSVQPNMSADRLGLKTGITFPQDLLRPPPYRTTDKI